MKRAAFLAVFVCTLVPAALWAEDLKAKTENGKEVILRDNGTWYYVGEEKKEKKATETYKGKRGTFTLSLAPGVWKKNDKNSNDFTEVEFLHKDKEAMAMIVAERIKIPLAKLKDVVVDNIRKQDKDAKIVKEEKRTVNGAEMLFLKINAKVQGTSFTYLYSIYSGDAGSIQLIAFTGQNLLKEFEPDMEAFLNGFEIVKK